MENDELAQHLESLQRESCYRIDAVLKRSPVEETQRVYFAGSNGAESGPFIRKFIKRGFGIGGAYERIYAAQQRGRRFKYIPDVLECYTRDDELVVVMELVRGQTLQDAVFERDPSVQLAREIFPKLCDAVEELHREFDPPIIHRDLKPSNVILTGEGLALIDFGISREFRADAETDTTHFGTREFAPPEQYGFGQTGVYSDVYSLGMVLYFCLTEKIPNAQARNQAFRDPAIPEALRQVIERAVALDPAMRFEGAGALKAAFLAAAGEARPEPPTAIRDNRAEARNGKRKGAIVAIALIVALCLVVAVGRAMSTGADHASQSASPSAQAEPSEEASGEGANADESTTTAEEAQLAADLGNPAAPKNGFDPKTNFTVEVAGVEFQIPSYFKAKTSTSEGGESFYYAESGSSSAMIMTKANVMDASAGRAEFEASKDAYLEGLLEADGLDEVTSSTDYELAGLSARVVTISGSIKGIPIASKVAFFYNDEAHTLGTIMFAQSNNTQFDYSTDFAKVITSARAVG